MNTAKNFTTIHLRLNWIDGLEALILLMACLIKVCVPIKTEDLNLSVFNMIAGINESKALTKHISCKCKCRFDGKNVIQINGGITIDVDVTVKKVMSCM